ncbi:MAG: inositol monophosphatase [Myxococcales bacterium]|nr:inositol monophosphatase [Myxococcales bacterium]
MSALPYPAELAVAQHAAAIAGRLIAAAWDRGVDVSFKGDVDLVTETDRAAEAAIVPLLAQHFPADAIVAEEGSGRAGGPRAWHVDPLDGTTNFSHGFPHFAVSIALVDDDGPLVGVVHEPLRRWTFSATRGGGAWLDGRRLSVSDTATLDRALTATGFPYDRRTARDNNVHRADAVLRSAQGLRRAGAAALDLAFVAAGWLDVFWEDRLSTWDLAAGVLLVTEAGGRVTARDGEPLVLDAGDVLASNGRMHDAAAACLRAADARFNAGVTP